MRRASSIQLRFVAEGAIAAAPPERPRSVATRDNPTHEPKRLAVAVLLIVVIVSGFGIYWAATEESRQWEQLCWIPELALDYPDRDAMPLTRVLTFQAEDGARPARSMPRSASTAWWTAGGPRPRVSGRGTR